MQHPVRRQSGRRPPRRHRDEPPGVSVECVGIQGHRFPDREDRRQIGDRLHARRDRQRHHQGNACVLRADFGLCRREGATLRFREVPRRRPHPDDDHEIRRRGDVVGPQLHRGTRQGDAVAGDQSGRVLDQTRPRRFRRRAAPGSADAHRRAAVRHGTGAAQGRHRRAGVGGLGRRSVVRRADRRTRHAARRTTRRAGAR